MNELPWQSIREKVAAWCQASYDRWKAESPAWLTPRLLAKIPDDCLPKDHLLSEPALVRRHAEGRPWPRWRCGLEGYRRALRPDGPDVGRY